MKEWICSERKGGGEYGRGLTWICVEKGMRETGMYGRLERKWV